MFATGDRGGNPAPIVLEASDLDDEEMQSIARAYGHESGFVRHAPPGSGCDWEFRFWVPDHEMEMCGHATLGAVWLLDRLTGQSREHCTILTRSGVVLARMSGGSDARRVEISQPRGSVAPIPDEARDPLLAALGLSPHDLLDYPIWNAQTSRVKTLIPLVDSSVLDDLSPDFDRVGPVCDLLGSTGLYPYAASDVGPLTFDARQFPRSSGYPEDAATGIAAAALAFGLLHDRRIDADANVVIRQGVAMGRPSRIQIRFRCEDGDVAGLWLGGEVCHDTDGA